MVGANKILTVSYGTFSCTLEGFDDSFSTMKAIAEYFRDLASDDRYFGAEPPTPDADMLARIAEREINKRVDAKIGDNSVVLRASDAEPVSAPVAAPVSTPAPMIAEAPVAKVAEPTPAPAPHAVAAPAPVHTPAQTAADEDAPAESESVAAKLRRIRAVVARNATAVPTDNGYAEDQHAHVLNDDDIEETAEAFFASDTQDADDTYVGEDEPTVAADEHPAETEEAHTDVTDVMEATETEVEDMPEDMAEVPVEDTPQAEEVDEDAAEEDHAAADTFGDDELTALLGRVSEDTQDDEAFEAEYEAETDPVSDVEDDDMSLRSLVTEINGEFEPADAPLEGQTDAVSTDDVSTDDEMDQPEVSEETAEETPAPQDAIDEDNDNTAEEAENRPLSPAVQRARARVLKIRKSDFDAAVASGALAAVAKTTSAAEDDAQTTEQDEQPAETPTSIDEMDVEQIADAAVDAQETDDAPESEAAESVAEFDDASPEDDQEESLDLQADAEEEEGFSDDTQVESSLPPEDEAALMQELAEVANGHNDEAEDEAAEIETAEDEPLEIDDSGDADEETDEVDEDETPSIFAEEETPSEEDDAANILIEDTSDEDTPPQAMTGRKILDNESAEDEASVARLLEETNTQLDNPETSRRRSAISHLRAAVAATVADRRIKRNGRQKDDDTETYRADLASVVKPRTADEVPDVPEHRAAPLMLVSEQRIDTPEHAAPAPRDGVVRPRRVQKSAVSLREVDENYNPEAQNAIEQSTSFADFAETLGATELPDLLEAAAAYTSYVEGQPHFTRPQVMRRVSNTIGREDFNREDALRAFGTLLRQDKFVKIKRGQFSIADTTRFKPDARVAGE